jgi:hypothetical protein
MGISQIYKRVYVQITIFLILIDSIIANTHLYIYYSTFNLIPRRHNIMSSVVRMLHSYNIILIIR